MNLKNKKNSDINRKIDFIKSNVNKVCRFCLLPKENELRRIYEKTIIGEENINVVNIIYEIASVQVLEDDKLPQHMCFDCLKELYTCYKFKRKCIESDAFLHRNIEKLGPEPSEKDPIILIHEDDIKNKCIEIYEAALFPKKHEISTTDTSLSASVSNKNETPATNTSLPASLLNKNETPTPTCNYEEKANNEPDTIIESSDSCSEIDLEIVKLPKRPTLTEDLVAYKKRRVDKLLAREELDKKLEEIIDKRLMEEETKNANKENISKTRKKVCIQSCEHCNIFFATVEDFCEHIKRIKHPKEYSKVLKNLCLQCNEYITTASRRYHMKKHYVGYGEMTICEKCGKQISAHNIHRHARTHMKERPFKCTFCEKSFYQKCNLEDHLNIHTGKKPNVCHVCGKAFFTKANYHAHVAAHKRKLNLEKYKCTICEKQLQTRSSLRQHIVRHNPKIFYCSMCKRSFASKELLTKHEANHFKPPKEKIKITPNTVQVYDCNICGKQFKHPASLKSHLLIHKGIRPFPCEECGKSFTQKAHLYYHRRSHSKVKPYKCELCDKSFRFNNSLKVHIRKHFGEKLYTCSICNEAFYDNSNLNKHLKKHHQDSSE